MTVDLSTTNTLLAVMATVSVLQAVGLVAMFAAGYLIVRRLLTVIDGIEARQIAPAAARVNAILGDVHEVTSTVKHGVDSVDGSARWILRLLTRRFRGRGEQP